MPRSFSSFSRSVSMPVSARTSAVLPWSMWPAVPTIMDLRLAAAQRCEVVEEAVFVFEATQVEHQRLILDAPDHRNGQAAQRRRERVRALARRARFVGADREPRARHRLDRQRAGADLAGACDRRSTA